MDVVFESLTQQAGTAIVVLFLAFLLLAAFVLRNALQQARLASRWRVLMQGADGQNLEALLEEHVRDRRRLIEELDAARRRLDALEYRMDSAKRHLGLVRYDAFEDVAGSQSFALALFDDQGNGAILTGLVGRSDCRVYCKPLLNGRSERNLSQEEQRAITEAQGIAPRTIVSP